MSRLSQSSITMSALAPAAEPLPGRPGAARGAPPRLERVERLSPARPRELCSKGLPARPPSASAQDVEGYTSVPITGVDAGGRCAVEALQHDPAPGEAGGGMRHRGARAPRGSRGRRCAGRRWRDVRPDRRHARGGRRGPARLVSQHTPPVSCRWRGRRVQELEHLLAEVHGEPTPSRVASARRLAQEAWCGIVELRRR